MALTTALVPAAHDSPPVVWMAGFSDYSVQETCISAAPLIPLPTSKLLNNIPEERTRVYGAARIVVRTLLPSIRDFRIPPLTLPIASCQITEGMHLAETPSDFVLFPLSDAQIDPKMLAVDFRQQQPSYASHLAMDPALIDPLGFSVEHLNSYGQYESSSDRITPSYLDPVYPESSSDTKPSGFSSMPVTPPNPTSNSGPHVSGLSSTSGPSIASASSSAIGSPYSGANQTLQESWIDTSHGLGHPSAVMDDLFSNDFMGTSLDTEFFYEKKYIENYSVDPSLVHRHPNFPPSPFYPEQQNYSMDQPMDQCGFLSQFPGASPIPIPEEYPAEQSDSQKTVVPASPCPASERRSSISSTQSRRSQHSRTPSSGGEDKEKGRCPNPECGKFFKDLKAHMLTHLSERPEKCPITTCEYHTKGFARKYDKNRHTLTHYKGTMVCGFCPGSGSPAEKSFNRADVFKRHLTTLHGVEQTPPNCRKKSPTARKPTPQTPGKCSTCSLIFNNPQEFYEHLDECVLRVVQQEEPSEAINQQRLAEVDSDEDVKKTMEKHMLLDTAGPVDNFDDENDDENDDNEPITNKKSGKGSLKSTKGSNTISRPTIGNNAVSKPSANSNTKTRSTTSRRRNNRDHYPQSWGCPSTSMKTKKRVLCVFDGQRRLWKDEMMLDNEFEVRVKLPAGAGDGTNREAYVTDLDVETMKRAEGVFSANDEERGPWLDGPSNQLIGQPATLLPQLSHPEEGDIIDELMY